MISKELRITTGLSSPCPQGNSLRGVEPINLFSAGVQRLKVPDGFHYNSQNGAISGVICLRGRPLIKGWLPWERMVWAPVTQPQSRSTALEFTQQYLLHHQIPTFQNPWTSSLPSGWHFTQQGLSWSMEKSWSLPGTLFFILLWLLASTPRCFHFPSILCSLPCCLQSVHT